MDCLYFPVPKDRQWISPQLDILGQGLFGKLAQNGPNHQELRDNQ